MGKHGAKQILELDPEDVSSYALLSSIFAAADNWHLCVNTERQSKESHEKTARLHLD
jgi:hypothetical protein